MRHRGGGDGQHLDPRAPGRHARRAGQPTVAPIVVGDGCWIGTRATLLPGVTVAPGCIVAAGAVLTRDTRPNGLYGGVPAVLLQRTGAHPRRRTPRRAGGGPAGGRREVTGAPRPPLHSV